MDARAENRLLTLLSIVISLLMGGTYIFYITVNEQQPPVVEKKYPKPKELTKDPAKKVSETTMTAVKFEDFISQKTLWNQPVRSSILDQFSSNNVPVTIYKAGGNFRETQKPTIQEYLLNLSVNRNSYSRIEIRNLEHDQNSKIMKISVDEYY
ncbi:MAG: hypothetical protein ABJP45_18625 [Cyclobacteriaceae bacterium]